MAKRKQDLIEQNLQDLNNDGIDRPTIQTQTASDKEKQLLEAVQTKLKITPNITRVMANSPALLEEYLASSGALAGGDADLETARNAAFSMWL